MAGIPSDAGVAKNSRKRQRDFADARADGRASLHRRSPRPVCRAAHGLGARRAGAIAELLAVGRTQRPPLSHQRQAGATWRGERLHRREGAGWRRAGDQRAAGQFYAAAGRRSGRVAERGDRGDSCPRDAPRLGGRHAASRSLVASRRSQRPRTCLCQGSAKSAQSRWPAGIVTFATARPAPRTGQGWISTPPDIWTLPRCGNWTCRAMRISSSAGRPRSWATSPLASRPGAWLRLAFIPNCSARSHRSLRESCVAPRRQPHPPAETSNAGPLVSFARSGVNVHWGTAFQSLLELAEACDIPTRWSCRAGVCHTCETGLVAGTVAYRPDPLVPPAGGNVLICCSRPRDDVVLDL